MGLIDSFIQAAQANPYVQDVEKGVGTVANDVGQDVSKVAQNLSPQGIQNTLSKGANTPVINELSGKEGPNAQIVAGMGMVGDADTSGEPPPIYDGHGNIAKTPEAPLPPPQEANGGQYKFSGKLPEIPRTTAEVKAKPITSGRGVYVPPEDTISKTFPQSTPLNPLEEAFPQTSATQQAIEKPFPKVGDQPVKVTDRTGTHPVTGGNPVWLDFSDQARKNPYYLEDQNKAQGVLDNYVGGNNPREVQANLPLQLTEESQRINNTLATDPQSMSKQNLIDNNALAMQKAAIKPGEGKTAQDATDNLITSLNNQINAGNKNVVSPDNISDTQLQTYIKNLDSYLQSAYKKIDNNATPTPEETAALTMRRTASSALKSMHPDIGDALDRQSAMIEAQPYVAKAASQQMGDETNAAIAEQNKPKPPGLVKRILGGVAAHPKATAGSLIGVGATTLTANALAQGQNSTGSEPGGETVNKKGDMTSQDGTQTGAHGSSISQSNVKAQDLETDPASIQQVNGKWSSVDPYTTKDVNNQPVAISQAAHDYYKSQLENIIKDNPGNAAIAGQVNSLLQINDQALESSKPINDATGTIQKVLPKINDALTLLNEGGKGFAGINWNEPNLLDALPEIGGYGVQTMQGASSNNYAKLSGYFNDIDAAYPGLKLDLINSGSPSNAAAKLNNAAQQIIAAYNQQLSQKVQGLPQQSLPSPQQATSTMPPGPNGNQGTSLQVGNGSVSIPQASQQQGGSTGAIVGAPASYQYSGGQWTP